ncbi:MAG TPA: CHRD domain-containing protein [Pseudomonadales bacterium]|nr:CHRD domain-containing protein [Pseudomonadales bacterium]
MALATASLGASAAEMTISLSGDQEVPTVTTMASGTAEFRVDDDMSLSGTVMTEGVEATAAHIHAGASGENGPVVVPLTKRGDNQWIVPADTILTEEQMEELEAGDMYVNVHSAAHGGGEIRGQLE